MIAIKRTGTAKLPLHTGKAPAWLFSRMVRLAREMVRIMVEEHGPEAVVSRFADPFWFQAFGCLLGFDWHSSGLTTTLTGAVKEAIKGQERDLCLAVAGGKGRVSRRTPEEVERLGELMGVEPEPLAYASRMSAKVDNTAVQDGYQLYHHVIIFSSSGEWSVVQQGMNVDNRYARRYHWLSTSLRSFVEEPHNAICTSRKTPTLNMVSLHSEKARRGVVQLVSDNPPDKLLGEMKRIRELHMPSRHFITLKDVNVERLKRGIVEAHQRVPEDFQRLLETPGLGPRTLRALALTAEVLYGTPVSFEDPARFSFAHGGKDGHPFPVDRETYDSTIESLREIARRMKTSPAERERIEKRLTRMQGFNR